MKNVNIFLSYCWKNQKEVDIIDNDLRSFGINIIRDTRSIKYKGSIKAFMDSVTAYDFVIVLISPEFLCSESCMYEISEILKDKNYVDKMLPIVFPSHDFLKPHKRIEYIRFWERKIVELNDSLKNVDYLVNINNITAELDHFHNIRSSIDEAMTLVLNMKCLTYDELRNNKYRPIFDYIGFSEARITEEILRIANIDDLEEQENQIQELLREFPNNEDILYYQMTIAFKAGDYELAGKRCEFYLKLFPDSAGAHSNYSLVLKRVYSELGKAKLHAERAVELAPKQPIFKYNLGNLFLEDLGNLEEAEKCYKEAIELNPNYFNAYESLGYLYEFEYKGLEKAEIYYLKALEVNPGKELIYHRLSNYYARLNKNDKAEEYYIKLLELNPESKEGHGNYGLFLYNQKRDYANAKRHYEKALEIDPYYSKAHYNYAVLMLKNYREFDKAEKHLKIAGMYDEQYKTISFKFNIELIKSIASKGEQMSGNDYNEAVLSIEFSNALLKLVQSIAKDPVDWFEVKDNLLQILDIHPKYDLARYQLMNVLRSVLGEYDEGFKHFLILLENNNDNPAMHHEVALIYLNHYKDYRKASEHLSKSIELNPNDAAIHLQLSVLYLTKLFEPELAKKHYVLASDLDLKCAIEQLDEVFEIKRT